MKQMMQNGIVLLMLGSLEIISSLNNSSSIFPHIRLDRHLGNNEIRQSVHSYL